MEPVTSGEPASSTGGQAQEPSSTVDPYADVSGLPWGQDPRFQQFLADRKAQAERLAAVDTYEPYKEIIDDLRNNNINSAAEFKARRFVFARAQDPVDRLTSSSSTESCRRYLAGSLRHQRIPG